LRKIKTPPLLKGMYYELDQNFFNGIIPYSIIVVVIGA
jgi:hypothetical protein